MRVEWLITNILFIVIFLQAKHNPQASIQSLCDRVQLGPLVCV